MDVKCTLKILDESHTSYEDDLIGKDRSVPGLLEERGGLLHQTVELLNSWVAKYPEYCHRPALTLLGHHLYSLLFTAKVRKTFENTYRVFCDQKGDKRLRLVLQFNKDAYILASYPWEFIYLPWDMEGHFLAEKTELVLTRFVPIHPTNLTPQGRPLRILIVYSHPKDLEILEAESVIADIKTLDQSGEVEVASLEDPTYDDLVTHLNHNGVPHILHFIGHGKPEHVAMRKPQEQLTMQVARHRVQMAEYERAVEERRHTLRPQAPTDYVWIPGTNVRELFKVNRPRLVFLQACQGAVAGSLEGFRSVAHELIYANVPAVVAMQYSIKDEVAKVFTREFYKALGQGEAVDDAVTWARQKLGGYKTGLGSQAWSDRAFGTPVLYLQTEDPIVVRGNGWQRSETSEEPPASSEPPRVEPCPYGCGAIVLITNKACVKCKQAGNPYRLMLCPGCGHLMAKDWGSCGNCEYDEASPGVANQAVALDRRSSAPDKRT